jgi:DNA-directed RNA polymerase subunit E'/Rpb7
MFLEILIDDTIVIEPEFLDEKVQAKIQELVKERYIGRIIKSKGVCLKVTKIQIKESKVANVSGNIDFNVKLACLIFSSFRGEVLSGVVTKGDKDGIYVDFCGIEVFIPESNLFRNTKL